MRGSDGTVTEEKLPKSLYVLSPGGLLEIYPDRREARRDGREVRLTRTEFDLLYALARSPGRGPRPVLPHDRIWRMVWGYDYDPERDRGTLTTRIGCLRSKLGPPSIVKTDRGVGYRLLGERTDPPSAVRVPDLIDRRVSQAASALADAGLILGERTEIPSYKAPEGRIVGQSPDAETEAQPGSPVSVVVSLGEPVTEPGRREADRPRAGLKRQHDAGKTGAEELDARREELETRGGEAHRWAEDAREPGERLRQEEGVTTPVAGAPPKYRQDEGTPDEGRDEGGSSQEVGLTSQQNEPDHRPGSPARPRYKPGPGAGVRPGYEPGPLSSPASRPAPGYGFDYRRPLRSFGTTVKGLFLRPALFFSSNRESRAEYPDLLIFVALCQGISTMAGGIISLLAGGQGFGGFEIQNLSELVLALILMPIAALFVLFVVAGALHLVAKLLVRPESAGFGATFRVASYSFGASALVSWIVTNPVAVALLGGVGLAGVIGLFGYFSVPGLREAYGTTTGRAVSVVVIGLLMITAAVAGAAGLFVYSAPLLSQR